MEWTDLLGWGSEMALHVVGQMEMDKSPENVFINPIHLASPWMRWKSFQVVLVILAGITGFLGMLA